MALSTARPPARRRNRNVPLNMTNRKERGIMLHDVDTDAVQDIILNLGDQSGDARPFECIQHTNKDKILTIVYRNKLLCEKILAQTSIRVKNTLYQLHRLGEKVTVVRVRNIPVDVTDEEIERVFEGFGTILQIKHWKHRAVNCSYMDGTYNGDRLIIMYRERDIPRFMQFQYTELNVSYQGQVLPCNYCKENDHQVMECPKLFCTWCSTRGHHKNKCPTVISCKECEGRHPPKQCPLGEITDTEVDSDPEMDCADISTAKDLPPESDDVHTIEQLQGKINDQHILGTANESERGETMLQVLVPKANAAQVISDAKQAFQELSHPNSSLEIQQIDSCVINAQDNDITHQNLPPNQDECLLLLTHKTSDLSEINQSPNSDVFSQSQLSDSASDNVRKALFITKKENSDLTQWKEDSNSQGEWAPIKDSQDIQLTQEDLSPLTKQKINDNLLSSSESSQDPIDVLPDVRSEDMPHDHQQIVDQEAFLSPEGHLEPIERQSSASQMEQISPSKQSYAAAVKSPRKQTEVVLPAVFTNLLTPLNKRPKKLVRKLSTPFPSPRVSSPSSERATPSTPQKRPRSKVTTPPISSHSSPKSSPEDKKIKEDDIPSPSENTE